MKPERKTIYFTSLFHTLFIEHVYQTNMIITIETRLVVNPINIIEYQ